MSLFQRLLLLFVFGITATAQAQTFKIDTLQYSGPGENMVNFVILGDGYTEAELDYLREDADRFVDYFFKTEPIRQYVNYFNVLLVNTVSEESGAVHDCSAPDCPEDDHGHVRLPPRFNQFPKRIAVPKANPSTIFGSSFDNYGIHRLVIAHNEDAIKTVLRAHVPNYTQVIILVNSPFYGGSGGEFPTATVNHDSNDIAVHEIGHSFANLGDEYWAGNMYAREAANRSQRASPDEVPWRHWLGDDGVGIYGYGGEGSRAQWFRPHEFCKMQYLVAPFCSVCQEQFVEAIHRKTSPVLGAVPAIDSAVSADSVRKFILKLAKPSPNTLQVSWYLNGQLLASGVDSISVNKGVLAVGDNELRAVVTDTTTLVRNPEHHYRTQTVQWSIHAPQEYALDKPVSTWGDTLATCYGGFQALSVRSPDAGLAYHWYESADSAVPFAVAHNLVTERLTVDKTYYVESRWGLKKSERIPVHVSILPQLPKPADVSVKRGADGNTVEFRVTNPDEDVQYVWATEDGKHLFPWNPYTERYEWRNQTSGVLTLKAEDVPDRMLVFTQDANTTCKSEALLVVM